MKGIVFTEFLEMVEDRHGLDFCDELLEGTDLASGGVYTSVGTYAVAELVALIGELSRKTATPPPEILQAFGRHLFGRFVVAYPRFFEGVDSPFELLVQVESYIHPEVLKLYPDAQLPRFEFERVGEDELRMAYRSPRHLEDLVEGLIRGCSDHFAQPLVTRRESLEDGTAFFIRRETPCPSTNGSSA